MFIWLLFGHLLYYHRDNNCRDEASTLVRLLGNIILVLYLRLIQVIMIAILILICCPLVLFCNVFRNNRPVAATTVRIYSIIHLISL